MATQLTLDTLYRINSNNGTLRIKSQHNAIEIQGGRVDVYSTIRTDDAVVGTSQMVPTLSNVTGGKELRYANYVLISSAAGTPVVYATFSVSEVS